MHPHTPTGAPARNVVHLFISAKSQFFAIFFVIEYNSIQNLVLALFAPNSLCNFARNTAATFLELR